MGKVLLGCHVASHRCAYGAHEPLKHLMKMKSARGSRTCRLYLFLQLSLPEEITPASMAQGLLPAPCSALLHA